MRAVSLSPSLKNQAYQLLIKNRRHFKTFQYTVPSPSSYPYQWLWDSAFHAIILSHFDLPAAKAEILSLLAKQFRGGMFPHMIYWQKGEAIKIDWGKKGTSSITQPPIIAHAVWQIYQQDQDKHFLKIIYPPIKAFFHYLLSKRDPRDNHLIGIINPDESGEDDSPRFDIPLGLPPQHPPEKNFHQRLELIDQNKKCRFDAPFCMKNFFWVKDVPFNAITVEGLNCLAKIATELSLNLEADDFSQQETLIKMAMRKRMLEDGIFYSTYGENYIKIKTLTWAIFAPLFANIYTMAEAEQVVNQHLLNPDQFCLNFLVPTVAKSEPSFNPRGFWRGPIWMASNWMIYKGLLNYGLKDVAKEIFNSSVQLIERSGFREQFNPQTGEGGGATEFTWGALILDM